MLGGVVSTSLTKPAYCSLTGNDTKMMIRNVGGFEEDPLLGTSTNKRVKFLYLGDALDDLT